MKTIKQKTISALNLNSNQIKKSIRQVKGGNSQFNLFVHVQNVTCCNRIWLFPYIRVK